VEKEDIILPLLLSGEGTSYPSGATKDGPSPLRSTRRIICSFSTLMHRKDKMFLLHLGAPEG
jgi:hypothetical protein